MSQQTTLHPTDHLTTENQTTKLTLTENATNDHNITTNYYGSDVSCQETQTNTLLLAGIPTVALFLLIILFIWCLSTKRITFSNIGCLQHLESGQEQPENHELLDLQQQ